jgi:hypothetical protein
LALVRPALARVRVSGKQKKADVAKHPEAFDHVGLLYNKPTGRAGLFFI